MLLIHSKRKSLNLATEIEHEKSERRHALRSGNVILNKKNASLQEKNINPNPSLKTKEKNIQEEKKSSKKKGFIFWSVKKDESQSEKNKENKENKPEKKNQASHK